MLGFEPNCLAEGVLKKEPTATEKAVNDMYCELTNVWSTLR